MAIADYDKCSLLLPCNENDGASIIDYSPRPKGVIGVNGAQITSQRLVMDGSNDFVVCGNGRDFNFGGGVDFLFSCFYTPQSLPGSGFDTIFSKSDASTLGLWLFIFQDGKIYFRDTDGELVTPSAHGMTAGNEYYIEATKVGTNFYVFIDGSIIATGTGGTVNDAPTHSFLLGAFNHGTEHHAHGKMRDVLVMCGVGGHTATYTPPAPGSLLKTISNASASNKVLGPDGSPGIRTIRAVPHDWPAYSFQTASDASGDFSLSVPDLANGYDVYVQDDAAGTVYNSLIHSKVVPG